MLLSFHHHPHLQEPRSVRECSQLFELFTSLFGKEKPPGSKFSQKEALGLLPDLNTKLKKEKDVTTAFPDINVAINLINELNNPVILVGDDNDEYYSIEPNNNNNEYDGDDIIDNDEDDDNIYNFEDVVNVDNDNDADDNDVDDGDDDDDEIDSFYDIENNSSRNTAQAETENVDKGSSCHRLSLIDMISKGKEKMSKMNVGAHRHNLKLMTKCHDMFLMKEYERIIEEEKNDVSDDIGLACIDNNNNVHEVAPFITLFHRMKNNQTRSANNSYIDNFQSICMNR